jgi:hypothetical protein
MMESASRNHSRIATSDLTHQLFPWRSYLKITNSRSPRHIPVIYWDTHRTCTPVGRDHSPPIASLHDFPCSVLVVMLMACKYTIRTRYSLRMAYYRFRKSPCPPLQSSFPFRVSFCLLSSSTTPRVISILSDVGASSLLSILALTKVTGWRTGKRQRTYQ